MDTRAWLGVDLPVVQAPMAGSQGSALALAVSGAGGLGSLPAATLDADTLRRELAVLQAGTTAPINVNFFCHEPHALEPATDAAWRAHFAPYYRELGLALDTRIDVPVRRPFDADTARIVAAFRPANVSFHFGLPAPELVTAVKQAGARVLASATTLDEARWLATHGADVIIAQGLEAGGHRGSFLSTDLTKQLGTFALVRSVVCALNVPVIAAGGIADAAGVKAALALGACAAQIGTAYLSCPEATTSAVHRAALASEAGEHTAITNLFTGRPARGIVNRVMRELGPLHPDAPAFPHAAGALAPLRKQAEAHHSGDFSPLWAGQNVRKGPALSAAELTRSFI